MKNKKEKLEKAQLLNQKDLQETVQTPKSILKAPQTSPKPKQVGNPHFKHIHFNLPPGHTDVVLPPPEGFNEGALVVEPPVEFRDPVKPKHPVPIQKETQQETKKTSAVGRFFKNCLPKKKS
jgi:hypothetical protein